MPSSALRSLGGAATLLFILVAAPQCSCASNSADGFTGPPSANIGPAGGSVVSPDGRLELKVPAGALASAVSISVKAITAGGAIGGAYDIEPSGTQFTSPVTVSIHYGGANLNGTTPAQLRVAVESGGTWQALTNPSLDTSAQVVSGTTMHLSTYGAVSQTQAATCLPVNGMIACGGMSSGANMCPTTTCDTIDPCHPYPSATRSACNIDMVSHTYDATCCFAPGTPVCMTNTFSGSSTPVPCAQAPACPGGSSEQSCADTAAGYEQVCCYPLGVVPSSGSSTGASSSAGSTGNGMGPGSAGSGGPASGAASGAGSTASGAGSTATGATVGGGPGSAGSGG